MNEQEIEGQLTRLARSDESVRAPESLHGFMYSLEASPAKHRSGLVSVRLPGLKLAHAAAGLAAAAVIAALLLTPYLLWVLFATYLSFTVFRLNARS